MTQMKGFPATRTLVHGLAISDGQVAILTNKATIKHVGGPVNVVGVVPRSARGGLTVGTPRGAVAIGGVPGRMLDLLVLVLVLVRVIEDLTHMTAMNWTTRRA